MVFSNAMALDSHKVRLSKPFKSNTSITDTNEDFMPIDISWATYRILGGTVIMCIIHGH